MEKQKARRIVRRRKIREKRKKEKARKVDAEAKREGKIKSKILKAKFQEMYKKIKGG